MQKTAHDPRIITRWKLTPPLFYRGGGGPWIDHIFALGTKSKFWIDIMYLLNNQILSLTATGWRGPKAPDRQEPAHVLPAGARCKAAEGRRASSTNKVVKTNIHDV